MVSDWSWRIDSSWSTDPAASALWPYLGPPGTVSSLLRSARWISPLRGQSPWLLLYPLVLRVPLPTDVLPTAAVPLVPVMLVARLCATPLPRCGTSSPGPKFTAEFKVRWSSVIPFLTRYSFSARQVSTLSLFAPWSPNSLVLHPWSPNSLVPRPWFPRRAVMTRTRRVSGKQPAICWCCCLDLWGVIQLLTIVYGVENAFFYLLNTFRRA